ncbi:biopolymer transporter ExbD [Panacibacter sp. DH6]|uniref:Biopolymer transporter ExbD n=1 Tax=Panacibacter microcysteis TaxID=2793269 RepID=A0A931GY56_9BACT|nr:biopolymer transporter ExbD [Panacibacter microcysteis]MBG9377429.1 biopolymer transporter ExbD [Panacibacter microcysteis]
MARPKIPRKSTSVDMTAMCDVAFLLLSFFILTTKFKPSEAVTVETPNSVASKIAPDKDVVMITLNKDGKVFLSTGDNSSDIQKKHDIISSVNESRNLGLSKTDIDALTKAPFIGVPVEQLAQQAKLQTDQMNDKTLPGIPAKDSTNNQMIDWMRAVSDVYQGTKVNLLLKGDNLAKYPSFKNVLTAFKKNKLFKFQMVTNPESVPQGSDLWKANMSGKAVE